MMIMFASIIDVLYVIRTHGNHSLVSVSVQSALDVLQVFEFAFLVHLMEWVPGVINALSQALYRRDQDFINAISLLALLLRCNYKWQGIKDGMHCLILFLCFVQNMILRFQTLLPPYCSRKIQVKIFEDDQEALLSD